MAAAGTNGPLRDLTNAVEEAAAATARCKIQAGPYSYKDSDPLFSQLKWLRL